MVTLAMAFPGRIFTLLFLLHIYSNYVWMFTSAYKNIKSTGAKRKTSHHVLKSTVKSHVNKPSKRHGYGGERTHPVLSNMNRPHGVYTGGHSNPVLYTGNHQMYPNSPCGGYMGDHHMHPVLSNMNHPYGVYTGGYRHPAHYGIAGLEDWQSPQFRTPVQIGTQPFQTIHSMGRRRHKVIQNKKTVSKNHKKSKSLHFKKKHGNPVTGKKRQLGINMKARTLRRGPSGEYPHLPFHMAQFGIQPREIDFMDTGNRLGFHSGMSRARKKGGSRMPKWRPKCRNGKCRDQMPTANENGKSEEGGGGGGESNHLADEVFHQDGTIDSLTPDQIMKASNQIEQQFPISSDDRHGSDHRDDFRDPAQMEPFLGGTGNEEVIDRHDASHILPKLEKGELNHPLFGHEVI